jgi:hypothetical protein
VAVSCGDRLVTSARAATVVEPAHPPAAMMRVGNPVMRGLLRSPAGGPMRRQFMVLRFCGRKTSCRYDIPVCRAPTRRRTVRADRRRLAQQLPRRRRRQSTDVAAGWDGMALVYLVQHGDKKRLPGDPGLTGKGRQQAAMTARWLRSAGLRAL